MPPKGYAVVHFLHLILLKTLHARVESFCSSAGSMSSAHSFWGLPLKPFGRGIHHFCGKIPPWKQFVQKNF